MDPAPGDSGTAGETRHIGGQHRCDRELRGAKNQGELPQPGRLIQQRGESGEQEAGDDTGQHESGAALRRSAHGALCRFYATIPAR